ncbi:MAG TPA: terminase large subunit [Solirubrobacteraceae bacterium]|nr:terminase large subunit [Solirubrobacteraceae bacterium]
MTLSLEDFETFCERVILDTGKPMQLEEFQRQMVRDFVDPDVRETFCVLPEASGKSTLLGVYCLYVLMRTPGATVVLASVTQQQAGSAMFRQASDAISRSPGLDRHLRAVDGRLRIHGPARARLDVKPSNPSTAQGAIPNLVVVDELGELRSMDLARVLRGKLSKRAGAKMIVVSSAGEPGGEFEVALEEMRNDAEEMHREGRHERYRKGASVVHTWRLLDDDSLTDWKLLKQANPLSTVTPDSLREKFESPLTNTAHFSRYTGGRAEYGEDHVIGRDVWEAATADFDELREERLHREILGVDFAMKYDTLALVPCILHRSGLVLLGPAKILEPPRPGQPIEIAVMQEAVLEVAGENGFSDVWLNPAAGSSPLEEWIDANVAPVTVYGMTHAEALDLTELFLSYLHAGKLKHTGDAALAGHVLNATPRYGWDGDRFVFTRPAQSRRAKVQTTRRIDALSAATLALKGASTWPLPFTAKQAAEIRGRYSHDD